MSQERHKIKASELQGFKYFKAISGMLESLHQAGCEYDRAGNRTLHMDQYMSLLLLYMFNPICKQKGTFCFSRLPGKRQATSEFPFPLSSAKAVMYAESVIDRRSHADLKNRFNLVTFTRGR